MSAEPHATALPELASVPWRTRTDERWLHRWGRIWNVVTIAYSVPFLAAGAALLAIQPLAAPVALAAFAHAWIIPELYAYRGASVLRPKRERNPAGERIAQGFLGDLLSHRERELQRQTGLVLEPARLGVWLRDYPSVLRVLTYVTLALEFLGPALALSPWRSSRCRGRRRAFRLERRTP